MNKNIGINRAIAILITKYRILIAENNDHDTTIFFEVLEILNNNENIIDFKHSYSVELGCSILRTITVTFPNKNEPDFEFEPFPLKSIQEVLWDIAMGQDDLLLRGKNSLYNNLGNYSCVFIDRYLDHSDHIGDELFASFFFAKAEEEMLFDKEDLTKIETEVLRIVYQKSEEMSSYDDPLLEYNKTEFGVYEPITRQKIDLTTHKSPDLMSLLLFSFPIEIAEDKAIQNSPDFESLLSSKWRENIEEVLFNEEIKAYFTRYIDKFGGNNLYEDGENEFAEKIAHLLPQSLSNELFSYVITNKESEQQETTNLMSIYPDYDYRASSNNRYNRVSKIVNIAFSDELVDMVKQTLGDCEKSAAYLLLGYSYNASSTASTIVYGHFPVTLRDEYGYHFVPTMNF